jgi:hypothetical protein
MQKGFAHRGGEIAIETDIRAFKGQKIVTCVVTSKKEPLARHGLISPRRVVRLEC